MTNEAAIRRELSALQGRIAELELRLEESEDAPVDIGGAGGGEDGNESYPLRVFVEDGYVCVQAGHHVWWNSFTSAPTVTTLEKDAGDTWVAIGGATVVYVKRVYNSDGTATVTLEHANSNYSTVMGGVTTTEARWILATIDSNDVITQWWTGGDLYELRVA